MDFKDVILLLHPVVALVVVFPLIGIVVNRALQTLQRRLQAAVGKSKIPLGAGAEHAQLGRWLTGAVVGVVLLALANGVVGNIADKHLWQQYPYGVLLIGIIFGVAITALGLLYCVQARLWRGVFATLAGTALVVLGCQDGVYRKTSQWYFSHYYYGITAALLLIFSLAILRDIYQDRTNRWRAIHITLNSIALLIFIGLGITGSQALLEIPLAWQEPYIEQLEQQQCDKKPCTVQPSPILQPPR